ncbi:hypothetical protein [Bacillus sp. FJAT-28004]|uniref:hypothetical protein n=1 Tax=Bacillus sp. FJAT-28004 TaxID=1679165 RepID=UPI0006B5C55D|nr:hypothetical protein [Bacillus sp. FJAT-28004]
MINVRALQLIEEKLEPIVKSGKRIDNIKLMVCPVSPIAVMERIRTRYGMLKIVPSVYLKKGNSYLREIKITRGGLGINWVSKK